MDYESGNWCEGITAYMADHLIKEQRGQGTNYRRDTLQKYRSFVKEDRDFPIKDFRGRHSAATEAVGYGKALMFFHMLRQDVGDETFRRVVTDFYRKNRGNRASFDDVRASFESVTGKDYANDFEQWIDRAGAPQLTLSDVSLTESPSNTYILTGTITQTQSGPAFSLNIPLEIATKSGQTSHRIKASDTSTPFSIELNERPTALAVDPAFDVFRLLDPLETPSSIGQLFGEQRPLAILPSSDNTDQYRAMMQAWQTASHEIEIVLDTQVESIPADRSVWILGHTNRFTAQVLDTDATTPLESVTLGGETVSIDGNSIVVIRRHPDNVEKAIGWIAVDPEEAFPGFIRKLPHYGKYSYLAFEGTEPSNFVKGQWDTTDSPLVYELEQGGLASLSIAPRAALAELPPVFSQRKLREHVEWLAAPERAGRQLGTPELHATAEYIAAQFESAGLVPGGDNGTWFQTFTINEGPNGTPVESKNVIGVLPGTRTDWPDQSIVIGAHYDHVGLGWPNAYSGNEGKVHPGADDNASGVSILLELARNMASEGGGSRNLVFVAFSAEESGLHGSKHYVDHPRFPVSGMRGMINMDTVGRLLDKEIAVHATGTADEWQHIFRGVGFVTGIKGKNVPARIGGSDQDSFIEAGVPAVQIFTGPHEDYHRPTDTPDKIDHAGLVKVATFVKEALAYLIEREPPMTVRIEEASESTATNSANHTHTSNSTRRVSFGSVPQFDFTGPGVKLEDVVKDSPAAKAGIQAGDILIRIDNTKLEDLRAFSNHLKTLTPGQSVVAHLLRDGTPIERRVILETR